MRFGLISINIKSIQLIFIIVSLILVVVGYFVYRSQSLEYLVSKTERAVFQVTTYKEGLPYKLGSGFFAKIDRLSKNDYVFGITNLHVAVGSDSIVISTNNKKQFTVSTVTYYSDSSDLIIFKWSTDNIFFNDLDFLKVEDDDLVKSQYVFSISHPIGLDYSFSSGVISSIRSEAPFGEIVQNTMPISNGSSGSPILSRKGKIIGVNTFSMDKGQNLNFAVRLNEQNVSKLIAWNDRSISDLLTELEYSVRIGDQVWMNSDLIVHRFNNGDSIPRVHSGAEWKKAAKEKEPAIAVLTNAGQCLYNWYSVTDSRKLCPVGWQIPKASDLQSFINFIGPAGQGKNAYEFVVMDKLGLSPDEGSFVNVTDEGKAVWSSTPHWWTMTEYWLGLYTFETNDTTYAKGREWYKSLLKDRARLSQNSKVWGYGDISEKELLEVFNEIFEDRMPMGISANSYIDFKRETPEPLIDFTELDKAEGYPIRCIRLKPKTVQEIKEF